MHYHLSNLLASLAPVYSGLRLRSGSPASPTASGSASNKILHETTASRPLVSTALRVMSAEKLKNFCGHLAALSSDNEKLSMRLLPWSSFTEDDTPVLVIDLVNYDFLKPTPITLGEVKAREYEIDGIELTEDQIKIWVYEFEEPLTIRCGAVSYGFQPFSESELLHFLKLSQARNSEQNEAIVSLRKTLSSIEKFVSEQEDRVTARYGHHPEGSEGHRLQKVQLNLLHRLRARLHT
ncbi:hypothetical protein [Allohahella marinimesophila]|uniref:Uncharacterized protein n=1 Tax=Allohahella marinimesophila TaxID=1054972 RepID=A0ABP7QC43_9GAMM